MPASRTLQQDELAAAEEAPAPVLEGRPRRRRDRPVPGRTRPSLGESDDALTQQGPQHLLGTKEALFKADDHAPTSQPLDEIVDPSLCAPGDSVGGRNQDTGRLRVGAAPGGRRG